MAPEIGRLSGKVALISGAASGIGRETARLFAREGAEVVLADIDAHRGREAVAEIGPSACFVPLDVTQERSWSAAVEAILQRAGRLDILVNSAGIWLDGDFISFALADWQRMMDVNATGSFLGCRFAVEAMRARRNSGAIVNISSVYGNIGADDAVAYAASKGAVRLLTKAVAMYCAAKALRVRCNSVHPTYVEFGNAGRLRGRRRRTRESARRADQRRADAQAAEAAGYRRGHSLSRIGLRSNDHGCGAARRRRHAGGHHRANQRSSAAVAMKAGACGSLSRKTIKQGRTELMLAKMKTALWAIPITFALSTATGAMAQPLGDTNTPINIALNEWTGQNLTAHIAGKLLEKLGYKVEYVTAGTLPQFTGIANGVISLSPEVWPSNLGDVYPKAKAEGKLAGDRRAWSRQPGRLDLHGRYQSRLPRAARLDGLEESVLRPGARNPGNPPGWPFGGLPGRLGIGKRPGVEERRYSLHPRSRRV